MEPLKNFKHLKYLDLFNNEATTIDNYREKIFKMIPSLKYLDGYDENDKEVEDSDGEEEVNGNDDESDEDEESSDDYDGGVGLDAVYSEDLDEMSDEGDYEVEEEEEEDGIEEEEEEEEEAQSPEGTEMFQKYVCTTN